MNLRKSICLLVLTILIILETAGCATSGGTSRSIDEVGRPEGWTTATHSNKADPDYDVVFPQNKVNQIKITISPEDWDAMQANMTELYGPQGTGQMGGQPGVPGVRPDRNNVLPGNIPQDGGQAPKAPGLPGWAGMSSDNPMWVPSTIEFNGLTWTNVGVRYKGNSSLKSGWSRGSDKLPLKLDFDEFEDEYPEIDNQRFYGFKQLSLSNVFNDSSYMDDTLAADILREAGLVAAETAYYEVILDYGEGPVNLGLYVVIEVIDDTVIDRFFDDDSGNIYEADGPASTLAVGTYDKIPGSFIKENNTQNPDWSDIEELYTALHSGERISDPEAWRENLESIFDVDVFLEWLAISAVMQHWDTYGSIAHNFYLYNDPDTGLLYWISWDHNQILEGSGTAAPGGARAAAGGPNRVVTLDKEEVGANWPLIRYLLDDPVYHEQYVDYIQKTIDGVFNPEKLAAKCQEIAKMIAPYVAQESTTINFKSAVQQLINRINAQYQAVVTFLAAEGK